MPSIFNRGPVVPVLRLNGPIGMATPLRPGLSLATAASAIDKAFKSSKLPSVAVTINSPGGSPVQSNLIFRRIRQLAEEKGKRVYVFCEDVAASGGYFLAVAGDEIYADPSSIVGSIGVIAAGFGLDKAMARYDIERRVYTSGAHKGSLDPFRPENPEDVARLQAIQADVHQTFIEVVKSRRGSKLKTDDPDLFSGAFWSGTKAVELGLIDGLADLRTKMRQIHGPDVRLKPISVGKGGLLSFLRRTPGIGETAGAGLTADRSFGDEILSTIERRALWGRYGL